MTVRWTPIASDLMICVFKSAYEVNLVNPCEINIFIHWLNDISIIVFRNLIKTNISIFEMVFIIYRFPRCWLACHAFNTTYGSTFLWINLLKWNTNHCIDSLSITEQQSQTTILQRTKNLQCDQSLRHEWFNHIETVVMMFAWRMSHALMLML